MDVLYTFRTTIGHHSPADSRSPNCAKPSVGVVMNKRSDKNLQNLWLSMILDLFEMVKWSHLKWAKMSEERSLAFQVFTIYWHSGRDRMTISFSELPALMCYQFITLWPPAICQPTHSRIWYYRDLSTFIIAVDKWFTIRQQWWNLFSG